MATAGLILQCAQGKAASAPPALTWTGFYVGLNGGIGGGQASPRYDLYTPAYMGPGWSAIDNQDHRLGGFFAGGQAGYNYQFGNGVLGVETDFQWSNIGALHGEDQTQTYQLGAKFPTSYLLSSEMKITQNWFGTTRLRLGYSFADRFLAYVTGGVAYSEFAASNWGRSSELSPTPGTYYNISGASTSTRIGWVVGAGVEYALTRNLTFKSEYLFSEYSGITAPYLAAYSYAPLATTGTFSTGTLGIHQVRAGVNYEFGGTSGEFDHVSITKAPTRPAWTGFYAGVNGGFGAGTLKPTLSELETMVFPGGGAVVPIYDAYTYNERLRSSGGLAGAQFGYNREFANGSIAGVETDLQWSGVRALSRSSEAGIYLPVPNGSFSSNSQLAINQDWFGTTRLRLGYQAFDRAIVYATAGVAYSGFSASMSGAANDDFNLTDQKSSGSGSSTRIGWVAGAGAEYALAQNLTFKTEYLYTQYAGFSFPYQRAGEDSPGSSTTQGTLSSGTLGIHLIRAGLSWKLGDPG